MNFRSFPSAVIPSRMLKVLCAVGMISAACISSAKPPFLITFKEYYKPNPSSVLGQAKCEICHGQVPRRNPYGKELKKLLDSSSDGKLTVDMLKQVEGADSDGDGYTNADEIIGGVLPGDPASHPSGPAGKATSVPVTQASNSIIPANGFHPIVIHFPIALFLFGVLLEFVCLRKKVDALGTAAVWNIHGALASMAIVVPTGVAAWLVGGHKLEGAMLFHMICAGSSLLLMAVTIVTRRKAGNSSGAYWAILLLTALVIGATGFFGGQMVYG